MPDYTISKIAEEFNLTLRTLRFWESRGLLSPARAANERIYSDGDREMLAKIVQWRQQQFTVEEIKSALARGGFTTAELRNQLEHLMETRRNIEQAIIDLKTDIGTEQPGALPRRARSA